MKDPDKRPITCVGKTLPCDMTEVPIVIVRAPIAIPIIASLTGLRSALDINLVSNSATNVEHVMHPRNIAGSPTDTRPAAIQAIYIVAPPPMPNRLGSPNELLVESCINIPANPKQPPTSRLTNILGIRMLQTIVSIIPSLDNIKPFRTSSNGVLVGPAKTQMEININSEPTSTI